MISIQAIIARNNFSKGRIGGIGSLYESLATIYGLPLFFFLLRHDYMKGSCVGLCAYAIHLFL